MSPDPAAESSCVGLSRGGGGGWGVGGGAHRAGREVEVEVTVPAELCALHSYVFTLHLPVGNFS